MALRKAVTSDIKDVQALINGFARRHKLIPRSLSDLYEKVRDITVYVQRGRVLGTCSLHVSWEDMAEIRSLAVKQAHQKKGIGTELIRNALREARELGVKKVFVLTYYPEYFKQFGFKDIDKSALPNKIWSDCLNCPKFPECDEQAVLIELKDIKE